jgi:tripartite-type tricarboxylate transporter receptor subunit TctC
MAPSIVTILHDAFKKALADPEFLESMKAQGLALPYQAPEDLITPSFMTMI